MAEFLLSKVSALGLSSRQQLGVNRPWANRVPRMRCSASSDAVVIVSETTPDLVAE